MMRILFRSGRHNNAGLGAALNLAAKSLWYTPGRFGIGRILGSSYSLRCVLFHNVSDTESPLTRGLGITITRGNFEAALKFFTRHYTPVRLQDVLTDSDGRGLPARPLLVTFDDAYASVFESAAPLCRAYGVPAVFFVNAASLDNRQLAPDNLICYVANVLGLKTINAVVRSIKGSETPELRSLAQVFNSFLPSISLDERNIFLDALAQLAGTTAHSLAGDMGFYLTSEQLRNLAAFDFEIGNHTYTHVHCISLTPGNYEQEIDCNKRELERISGKKVRSFSVPYGSSSHLTIGLEEHLQRSGYTAAFLSESLANPADINLFRLNRVSVYGEGDAVLFAQIEILPRLRAIRNRLFKTADRSRHGSHHLHGALETAKCQTADNRQPNHVQ